MNLDEHEEMLTVILLCV